MFSDQGIAANEDVGVGDIPIPGLDLGLGFRVHRLQRD